MIDQALDCVADDINTHLQRAQAEIYCGDYRLKWSALPSRCIQGGVNERICADVTSTCGANAGAAA